MSIIADHARVAGRSRRLVIKRIHKRAVANAQNQKCAICGGNLDPIITGPWGTTVDHALPKSRGGLDGIGNYLAAHQECNRLKGSRLPNGCELIMLLAVNCRLGVHPKRW